MPTPWLLLILTVLAYILGSIPFGLIVGLSRGVDPRAAGSGNIGATNVGRLLGGKFFALVFILDLLKGLLPMIGASLVVYRLRGPAENAAAGSAGPEIYALWLLVGFAAIAGHMFSVFIGFKGGKGVATSAGVLLGLFPYYTWPAPVAVIVWLVLFALKRYVSLASIAAAAVFPIAFIIIGECLGWPIFAAQWPLVAFAFVVAGMIVYKHRQNIQRLLAGAEHGFGAKKKTGEPE